MGARRPDGRAARSIQQAELDADRVGDFAHDAAEGVDFADQMSLGDAADGGIAGHLRDQVDVQRVERGLQAHAGRGHGGFASGMSGADHDYVELFGELHGSSFYRENKNLHHRGTETAENSFGRCTSVKMASCHWSEGKYQLLAPAS